VKTTIITAVTMTPPVYREADGKILNASLNGIKPVVAGK